MGSGAGLESGVGTETVTGERSWGIVDAVRETRETREEREKHVEKKGLVQYLPNQII